MNRFVTVTDILHTVGLNWSDVPFKKVKKVVRLGGGAGQKQI